MAPHVSHIGVHDHGFNNVSTYGNLLAARARGPLRRGAVGSALLRAGAEGQRRDPGARAGHGFPAAGSSTRSTARTRCSSTRCARSARWRSPTQLGHRLSDEQDAQISLLERLLQHARATAEFSVYYGRGRDTYDVRGRVVHESMFNAANGSVPRPEHAAGLLAVQHVDARPGVGDARIRRGAGVPRDA